MMVFRAKATKVYKLRVTDKLGNSAILSTGTDEKTVAADVERMVKGFKSQRRWAMLTLLATKKVKLGATYDAFVSGKLDEFMAAELARVNDADLDPLVSEWAARANPKYVRQVRRFIPAGARFPASTFRRREVSAFLAGLKCDNPTRNRYRAALSQFGKWLVEREVIETNVVRDVAMYRENDPRMVWMTWGEAVRVADAANEPYRTLFYLMAATGMELGAALRLTRADVVVEQLMIHARGSKTVWRNRVVKAEPFARSAVNQWCRRLVGAAPLFPNVGYADALDEFKAAQKAVGLSGHRLHDLRHTYAVNALKQGYKPQVVAHQLGHKDATMVTRVYGRFVPDASDYATAPATSTRKKVKRAR